ncbi:hypothetical protein DPMN_010078 [Dreissena polymorpha]|uniref:Uncharacterized protein n=1 Tax=Dreissena polymorpha TaxID=45954 RepID=A0A9D4N3I3_DREPO|nr:hypothetical protein DPMN_010078 [Dreissena polymorpha]
MFSLYTYRVKCPAHWRPYINKTNVLTNFHDDWAKIVTSRVFTRKTAPPTDGHVFQQTGTILELNSRIKETNVLTKFHENWPKNVTSRVVKCPAHWRPYINKTNVLTNFHDDWAKIVTFRVFTRKTAPPTDGHVSQRTGTILELNSRIKETNVLTKFHENWAKNVTSRVVKCPAHWRPYINKTNVLTNFHDDWAKIVTSRVFTRKTAPPTGGHVFQRTGTILELNSRIKETNVLTKFHENWAKNVTSRVVKCPAHWRPYINKTNVLTNFHDDWAKIVTSRVFTRKTAPPTGGHVFQRTGTILELNSRFKETNVLTKFHENWAKNVTSRVVKCPAHWWPYINKTNVLTNFHDDWAIIVTSRVFTMKTAPPTGGHVFQRTGTNFELNQHIIKINILTNFELDRDIIGTNVLTEFHEDWTKNVASRVFTNKCGRTDRRRTKTGHKSVPER